MTNPRDPVRARLGGFAAHLGAVVGAGLVGGALLLAPLVPARADVVTTKDGKSYEGKVVSQDGAVVVIETTFDGRRELAKDQVTKVDTATPPLRSQLEYRMGAATDAAALTDLAGWAKAKGFKAELETIWKKVLEVDPPNVKAHKALGHLKVGAAWMTPEEKAKADAAADEAAWRAKGFVPYQGRWVTPQEKDALEKGLMKDGDEWVTEAVFHARRGETKVGDAWVRVGEAEGKVRAKELGKAIAAELVPLWSPHLDLYHELAPADGQAALAAGEKAADAFYRLMKPEAGDKIDGMRIEVVCLEKSPAYARYVQRIDQELGLSKRVELASWAAGASRMRSFWWTDPKPLVGAYLFPNTIQVLESAVAHDVSYVLLNRYRFNFRFSSSWLFEGLAYWLEMQSIGRSATYTIGRGGIAGGADTAAWQDSAKWRDLLKAQVLASQDTSTSRLASYGFKNDALTLPDLVKCWSLVDYLIGLDRAKWKAFVDGTKDRSKAEEDALKTAYGVDYKGLETQWRAYVSNGFKAP